MRTMSMASRTPARRALAAVVAQAALAAAPASALACGLCTDAAMRRAHWQTSVALALVAGLGTEAIVYVLCCLVLRRETGYPRAPVLLAAGFAAVAVGLLTGMSGFFMASTFAVGLLATYVRSLWEDAGFGAQVLASRVLLVAAVVAAMVARAHPSQVKTPRLVTTALFAADSWGEGPHGWVEEQLVFRPDAKAEVEQRLETLGAKGSPGPAAQDVELFRLHRLLGGDPARRAALCQRWGVTATSEPTVASWHERPRPPDGLLSRLCFPAAER